MFLNHLIRHRLLETLRAEHALYKLERRHPTLRIVRPFSIVNAERFIPGDDVQVHRNCHFHCGGNDWSNGRGLIKVGKGCWFGENNVIYGAGDVEIGEYSGTGPCVQIYSSRDNYDIKLAKLPYIVHQFGKVVIGSHVRIFAGAIVVPGVTVGEGAIIGAGAIVTTDVPPWSIALGAPARVVGERGEDRPIGERSKKTLA